MAARIQPLFFTAVLALVVVLTASLPACGPLTDRPTAAAATATSTTATATITATAAIRATVAEMTPAVATTAAAVRFAVIGDYGLAGPPAADVADLVMGWQPDFIITTGDNNYPDGAAATIDRNIGQYYADYIYPYYGEFPRSQTAPDYNRFFPSLGNHDYYSANAQPYLDYFTLPGNERYYDFIWGPVHLFAVNSDFNEPDGVQPDSRQADWLRQRLAESTAPWRIVYMHVSPYSSGRHGSHAYVQWPLAEWGATAVLSGHDHIYERLDISGLAYFVNGLGGHPSRYLFLRSAPGSQVRFRADHGALQVEATAVTLTFQFITRTGLIIDTHELNHDR
jgi:tartrate-resistant acid phosphatase type 5